MPGLKLSNGLLAFALGACLVGCGRSALSIGERAQLDGGIQPGDDSNVIPMNDAGDSPGRMDSSVPSDDGGSGDAAMDGGFDASSDGAIDGDVIDDGGTPDADKDAEILDPDPLMCEDVMDLPRNQLGTPWEPFEYAFGDAPLTGEVDWRGRAFVRVTGLTVGETYAIALEGEQLGLAAFPDGDAFGTNSCNAGMTLVGYPAVCVVTATRSTVDLTLHAVSGIRSFQLSVSIAEEPEGTREAPLALPISAFPRELHTAPGVASFYEITGLDPATTYAFTAPATERVVGLAVFSNGYSSPPDAGLTAGGAIGRPIGTSLFVAAIGLSPDDPISIEVAPASGSPEGTADSPINIDASELPYEGQVGWAYNTDMTAPPGLGESESYYAITGLTPGDYVVSLEARAGMMLEVNSGEPFSLVFQSQCSAQSQESSLLKCGVRADDSTLYVKVVNRGGNGAPLKLSLETAATSIEGSEQEPVELTPASLPYAGQVLGLNFSEYRISGLKPGQAYDLRIGEQTMQESLVWVVDAANNNTLCDRPSTLGAPVHCKLMPSATTVRVRIASNASSDGQSLGGTFMIDLTEIDDRPTSSLLYPSVLECTEGNAESVFSASGEGFYGIRGLTPGVRYIVEAHAGSTFTMEVYAEYESGAVGLAVCTAYGDAQSDATCLVSAPHGALVVSMSAEAIGDPFELVVRRATSGSEGTWDEPAVIAVDQLPYAGRAASASPAVYAISGLTPGATYTLQIATAEEELMIRPYADLAMTNPLSHSHVAVPGVPAELRVTPTRSTFALELTVTEPADWVTDVWIDVLPE